MEPESSATIAVDGARIAYRRIGKDHRGVDLNSDALPFGRLWYAVPNAVANAIGSAEHRSCSHDAVLRVYDESGAVIATRIQNANRALRESAKVTTVLLFRCGVTFGSLRFEGV